MIFTGHTNEFFEVQDTEDLSALKENQNKESVLTMLWFQDNKTQLQIDGQQMSFDKNNLVFLTSLHNSNFLSSGKVRLIRFNAPFYCILDHDAEVGCRGLLFFGSKSIPVIKPTDEDLKTFSAVWGMLIEELKLLARGVFVLDADETCRSSDLLDRSRSFQ